MKLTFTAKHQETPGIWSFIFLPSEPLAWIAGQSLRLEVPGPYGPLEHRFTIASAPSSGHIMVTTRLSDSDYKESLAALQPGTPVNAYAVEGDFIWHDHKQPPVFVAAGIGITPVHAIVTERASRGQRLDAHVIYGSTHNPPLFYTTFAALAAQHAGLTLQLHPRRITATDVLTVPQAAARLIYISGPSKMVDTLRADLIAAGIPAPHIVRDQFTGHLPLDG